MVKKGQIKKQVAEMKQEHDLQIAKLQQDNEAQARQHVSEVAMLEKELRSVKHALGIARANMNETILEELRREKMQHQMLQATFIELKSQVALADSSLFEQEKLIETIKATKAELLFFQEYIYNLLDDNKKGLEQLMEENTQLEEQLKERDYQVNLLKHRLGHVSRSYDNLNNTKMIIVLKKYWKVRK
ncbi:hypothetical protein PGRAN_15822, partial [Listeria grandensis FSL F6-0971]